MPKVRILWIKNCPFFSLRHTTHVQINHAVKSAVRRIPVLMEGHAPSCATTPNKSSTAHAPKDFLESSVKRKVLHFAATTRRHQAEKFYCIHLVWSRKQVFLPNLLWSYFWKWIRLDSSRVLQLSQQKRFQESIIPSRLPSERELFQVEQVSPLTAENEFNAEPFFALPSNLQLQHWWTGNHGSLKSQDNWSQYPAVKQGFMCQNGIYQHQRLWLW